MAHAPQVALLCHLYQFFSAAENGEPFTQHELKDESFRKWLSTHPEVFRMLALSGAAGKQTLSIFYRIWNANNKTLRPVETSMALGAGLASNVIPPEECLSKFNFYRESYFQSACHPQADTMQPWEWAIVFRGRESLEDLSWAQQFIEKKQIPPEQAGNKFMGFIPYRRKNLQGVSVHAGAAFYDHKPVTLKLYTEYGGVCGRRLQRSGRLLRAKGVPAWAIGSRDTAPLSGNTPADTGKSATISADGTGQREKARYPGTAPSSSSRLTMPLFITVWRKNPS